MFLANEILSRLLFSVPFSLDSEKLIEFDEPFDPRNEFSVHNLACLYTRVKFRISRLTFNFVSNSTCLDFLESTR